MSAEADVICGAGWGERSPDRVNRRSGYRTRRWDTRVASIELGIPKLRRGSFPDWLLDARTRSERAFVQVVPEAYVRGISTRRVEGPVEALGSPRCRSLSCRSWPGTWTRPSPGSVSGPAQHRRVVDHTANSVSSPTTDHLDQAATEMLAFTGVSIADWRQI